MVTIFSIITRKEIIYSQGYDSVKVDVKGSVSNKLDECRKANCR